MTAGRSTIPRTVILTATAMIAFAANSLLCRMALGQDLIDAASFTSIRVLSGALVLVSIVSIRGHAKRVTANWPGVAALFGYMVFFSFAYLSLSAGTGALLLFGAVQLTMFAAAIRHGERFSLLSWTGLGAAFAGLVYLVAPGVTAPDPLGAVLMATAGVAWGVYSLIGRKSDQPLLATASNFVYSVPLALALGAVFIAGANVSLPGVLLAVASGALASGLGYAIWYAALAGLTASRAATVQLSVPVIAAVGGVLLLSEQVTMRLVVASGLTIGGIWVVLAQRSRRVPGPPD
jgi:drug/metabolite transporter (DMT)-like permease